MRVEVGLFRSGKENIDLGWLLLDSLYRPGSHDTNNTFTSKAVIGWRKCNDGSGDQTLRVFPDDILAGAMSRESNAESQASLRKSNPSDINLWLYFS